MFRPGDRARRISTGEEGVVREALHGGFYEMGFPSGVTLCPEADLEEPDVDPDAPGKLLRQGKLAASELYALYLQSAFLQHAFKYDDRAGLSSARIEPQLHQIYVTLQVLRKLRARMILADEVGLGKTIEAGLIIKELRARCLADRVLIVCPASLVDQWQQELETKFNEAFVVFNREALNFHRRGKQNPWIREDSVICSLPFATRHREDIVDAGWDLVVFDEAHKLNRRLFGKKWDATKAWELADELKDDVEGLLLLTATPMQLDTSQLYSLLDIVEPGLFGTYDHYLSRSGEMPMVNMVLTIIEAWDAQSEADRQEFIDLMRQDPMNGLSEIVLSHLNAIGSQPGREELIDELVRRHPLAGVMVRNRKSEIGGFKKRKPHTHHIRMSLDEEEVYNDVTDYIREGYGLAQENKNLAVTFLMVAYQKMLSSSSAALAHSFRRRIDKLMALLESGGERLGKKSATQGDIDEWLDAPEASEVLEKLEQAAVNPEAVAFEIERLQDFVARLEPLEDTKAKKLVEAIDRILRQDPNEKVLVFTQFIETQRLLGDALEQRGYRVSLFSGRLRREEKEDSVCYFRDRGQVMISTEAGGEGRNFQFCHIMFNFDLPWNPMRVEQRIGRLDRIGQKHDIQIHNFAVEGTVEERILDVLRYRIRLFEESVGALDPILGEVEKEIETFIMSRDVSKIEELGESIEEQVQKGRARESAEQNLAMDLNSLRRDKANEWLSRKPFADWQDLERYVSCALDYFGGRLSKSADGETLITLSPKMGAELRVRKPKYVGDFDPLRALAREELDFFAFGHEVVDGLVAMPGREPGSAVGCRVLDDEGPPVAVEVFYEIAGTGSGRVGRLLQRGRFIRHEVGRDGQVRSEMLTGVPERGGIVREVEVPDWVSSALDASWTHFSTVEYASESRKLQEEIDRHRADELERARRVHEHRSERLQQRIREREEWLAKNRDSASAKIIRVLPAREGALAKAKQDLERLNSEYEIQIKDIERAGAGLNTRVVATGLVVRT